MGLILVPAFALYVLISIITVVCAIIFAKKWKKNLWLWGGITAFIMYNLVFWDWIPTVAVHKYYCSTQAGFWVYKTADEWKAENPDATKTIGKFKRPLSFQIHDGIAIQKYKLNKRVIWEHRISSIFLSVRKYEDILIDIKSNSELAKKVYFESGKCSGAPKKISDMKIWINQCSCKTTSTPFVNEHGLSWSIVYNQLIGEGR